MRTCTCGVEVQWTTRVDTGERVLIEPQVSEVVGPDRYVVLDAAVDGWKVKPLDPKARASGHPDHLARCPRA